MSSVNPAPEPSSSSSLDTPTPGSKWLETDPRTSSTQSLAPSDLDLDETSNNSRRRLLLVYVHGYQGTNQSFKQFPFHVHQYLKLVLGTHAIHTKVYPRYKTYRSIEVARDNFSTWLEPHESDNTDVVLIGHSMGGLLAADVALMPNRSPYSRYPYKHRVLGTLSLDSPFLGLHPGIIVSGLASIFKPSPQSPKSEQPETDSVLDITSAAPSAAPSSANSAASLQANPHPDPYFNPPFFNDVFFKERPLKERLVRFVAKNRDGIVDAVANHLQSHLEYGACLTDYPSLNRRYSRLRNLENLDELACLAARRPQGTLPTGARVRFANFYTVCAGRKKEQKERAALEPETPAAAVTPISRPSTPRISIEDCSDAAPSSVVPGHPECGDDDTLSRAIKHANLSAENLMDELEDQSGLPPIPDAPDPPDVPDLDEDADDEARRRVEKEAKRARKTYEHQMKDREKAIKEREKLIAKREKQAKKDAEKQAKLQQKQEGSASRGKSVKERKFCTVPQPSNGGSDDTWIKVDMGDVDEVRAHCGLFLPGPHYNRLIADVSSRIQRWVEDDMTKRTIMGLPPD